jgi:hypothetical protein
MSDNKISKLAILVITILSCTIRSKGNAINTCFQIGCPQKSAGNWLRMATTYNAHMRWVTPTKMHACAIDYIDYVRNP